MPMENKIRLDKYIQLTCLLSKKEIHTLLKDKQVRVDGNLVVSPKFRITDKQKVSINQREIQNEPFVYYMLNKPKGVISALKDENELTVLDLLNVENKHTLRIMGRLDKDTTGLMILTNNTALIKSVTLLKYHVSKTYEVVLKYPVDITYPSKFLTGIIIDDNIACQPAYLSIVDEFHVIVELYEGKYHQIKKMFRSLNNEVIDLKRIKINQLTLDKYLLEGMYRKLTEKEVEQLSRKKD